MRFLLDCARKDLRRIRRDPVSIVAWVGIPILIGVLLVGLLGRGESRPHGILLVADQDDTFVSMMVANAYTQGDLGEMLTVEKVPLEEGEERIRRGGASALLVIPEGFSTAFLEGKSTTLRLVKNPAQSILPAMIEEITSVLTDAAHYLQTVAASDLAQFADFDEAPSDEAIAAISVRMKRLGEDMSRYLDPPLIELSAENVAAEQEPLNMASLMFPSVIYMAVLFLAFGQSIDLWKEKKLGTLRRLLVTPASVASFLGGKMLALGLVLAAMGATGLAASRWLAGIEIHAPPLAVAWIVLSGAVLYLFLILIHVHLGRERAATTLTNVLVLVFAMVGGSFFPFEVMPSFMANIGRMTPNGWALEQLKTILDGEAAAASFAPRIATVLAVGALAFWIACRRIRGRFAL